MFFVSIVYLGGLHCCVLYSAICTAQWKTAKVIIFCFLPSDQLGFYYIKFLFFSFFNAGNLAILLRNARIKELAFSSKILEIQNSDYLEYENFGNESPGNDIAYNGPPGIHFDDHFLNVNFVDIHIYEASSELTSSKAVSVAGRLHANFSYWKETLQATEAVLDIMRNGYGLPFTSIPQHCFIKNNKSALMHPKFVEDAIFKLLEDGCIQDISSPPRSIRYLLQKGKN